MKNKTRFIPLVIIGAVLLSLLAIVPAFGADEVGFIDPTDINPNGTLSDSTPDDQEWARQGGRIGLMNTDSGSDTAVKRVLIPSLDASSAGSGDVGAHSATITRPSSAAVSQLREGDFILIGNNTVREIVEPVSEDEIVVDKPFASGMNKASIYRIMDDVTDLSAWDDNYSSYAMAEKIVMEGHNPSFRRGDTRYDAESAVVDSNVASTDDSDPLSPAHRLSGTGTGNVNSRDVLVVAVDGSNTRNIPVDAVDSSGRVEMLDLPSADANNPLGLAANETAYLVYWAEERNEATASVRSQAHPTAVTVVLTETSPRSGQFVLEIETVEPQDVDGNDVLPNLAVSPPTLPVNPNDVVTLSGADTSGSITVETTGPVFTGLTPAHNTSGRDERPEVTAQVTDSDSGVSDDKIYVIFRIAEGASTDIVMKTPESDGDVDEISGGYEIQQRITGDDAPDDDAEIDWWIKAIDNAGNVGYSDRQATVDDEDNPCKATAATPVSGLADVGCQPYKIIVDQTSASMERAETGRHWVSGLSTGDSDDKTEYRASKADDTSVLVVFNEHLDDSTVSAADFEVANVQAIDAEVHNVTVRDMDGEGGDGNSEIMGDDVQEEGETRGYVFLTVDALEPNAEPKVELVGEVFDIAGNRTRSVSRTAIDRVAPALTVSLNEGDRPVTKDKVNLSITSDENIRGVAINFYRVESSDGNQTLGAMKTAQAQFKSATEYTATLNAPEDGLYTVHVTAHDNSGGNMGSKGSKSDSVDVDGETSAILFERDTNISAPDVDPDADGIQDAFSIDDPDAFIRIDFSGEGSEYDASENEDGDRVGDDLDDHGMVTIVSAMLGDEDVTDSLQSNEGGNVFLFRASGLDLGEHDLAVVAMDEAGNKNASAFEATITITERDPYTLKLNPGWNLVSIPGEPMDSDINAVIPADHPAMTVLSFDPSVPGGWLTALRGSDGSFSGTLTDITAGRAYWINTPSFEGVKVDIPKQAAGVAQVLPTISIAKGWNLIPILDVDGDFELSDAEDYNYFNGLSEGTVTGIYTFNTITNSWSSVAQEDVEIGKGYWVYATDAGVIVP